MIDERLKDATDGVKAALIDMVPPPIEDFAGDSRVETGRVASTSMSRGPLIAIGTAVAILVVVAVGMLFARGGDPSEVVAPVTPSTVPATTTPVVSESGFINEVQDLALASDGAIWAATRGGVVRWDPGESIPVVYGQGDGLLASDVFQIAVAADRTVWAAGNRWAAYFDQTWQTVEVDDDVRPSALVADPTGGVWTYGDGRHLAHINRSGSERIHVPFMAWSASFAVDDAGRVYAVDVMAGRAVYVYDEGSWREFTTLPWSPGDAIVTNIAIASDGTLWISTLRGPESEGSLAHGVAAFDGQAWTTYTTDDGLASDEGYVVAAPDGTVWVVHEGAVSRFDGDTWTAYNVDASRFSGAVAGSDGTLWIGTNDGIALVDGDTTTRQVAPTEMAPVLGSFSLEPVGPAAAPADAGSFGEVTWQKYSLPAGHSLSAGIATPYGFAARGSTSIRTSIDGLIRAASETPREGRLVASDQDL